MSFTTDKTDPELGWGSNDSPVPQNKKYLVLSEEERSKGFVRPLRTTYIHRGRYVGKKEVRPLTEDEVQRYEKYGYAGFVENDDYPDKSSIVGTYLTKDEISKLKNGYVGGCNGSTTMHRTLAETYATDPAFYGSTYCSTCMMHRPVSEFVWEGTNELVGS